MIILFGEFTGGAFRVLDSELRLDTTGVGLLIDGSRQHYSEEFSGNRFSVVAFLHNQTENLSMKDKYYLKYLGFCFGGGAGVTGGATGGLYETATVVPAVHRRS